MGVDFVRDVNLGKASSLHGNVVVIGGGNVAIDVARNATRVGAKTVNLYCLENRMEMPALEEECLEAEEEGIIINNSLGPKRILTEDGKVVGVEFVRCKSVFDQDHRFSPVYDENDTVIVDADYVLVSVGQSIEWGELVAETKVTLNQNKTIGADPFTYQTAEPDIFVGGDSFTGPRFAIDAIAAGKQGAISIHRFVQPGQNLIYGRDRRAYQSLDKSNIDFDSYDRMPRQKAEHDHSRAADAFADTRVTFTEEQMKKETQRCLGCGATEVDEFMCVGCGQCTTKCKFDAIKLVRVYDKPGVGYEDLKPVIVKTVIKRKAKIAVKKVKNAFSKAE